jgi:MFS family permease
MPLVYALALGIGLASAFSIPAVTSLAPNVFAPEQLQLANGMMMSMRVATALAGPLLAGLLIAFSGHDPSSHDPNSAAIADTRGLGIAFAFDALSFALTTWTLHRVQLRAATARAAPQPVLRAVGQGLAMVWRDAEMRSAFLYWAVISLVIGGTMQVAMPVLVNTRLGGAAVFGLIMGAHGAGSLAGMGLSALKGNFRIGTLGTTLLTVDALAGLLLMLLGDVYAAWQGAAIMFALGAMGGFIQVAVFTWIQRRVPREMMGRTMSIFMFIMLGLAPLAASVTGLVMQYVTLPQLFVGAGLFLLAGTLLAFLLTPMRLMNDPKSATIPGSNSAN